MDTPANESNKLCNTCSKTSEDCGYPLKQCSSCKKAKYCSRECQTKDWKAHKKVCTYVARSEPQSLTSTASVKDYQKPNTRTQLTLTTYKAPRGIGPVELVEHHCCTPNITYIYNSFQRLHVRIYLHDRPEEDVYKLLIDCFRLRVEDAYTKEGKVLPGSILDEPDDDGLELFVRYLHRVERATGLLPRWWNDDKTRACAEYGKIAEFSNIFQSVMEKDLAEHYGALMPLHLRLLAQQIYSHTSLSENDRDLAKILMMNESEAGENEEKT